MLYLLSPRVAAEASISAQLDEESATTSGIMLSSWLVDSIVFASPPSNATASSSLSSPIHFMIKSEKKNKRISFQSNWGLLKLFYCIFFILDFVSAIQKKIIKKDNKFWWLVNDVCCCFINKKSTLFARLTHWLIRSIRTSRLQFHTIRRWGRRRRNWKPLGGCWWVDFLNDFLGLNKQFWFMAILLFRSAYVVVIRVDRFFFNFHHWWLHWLQRRTTEKERHNEVSNKI